MKASRAFTIAESLVVIVIVAMLLTAVAGAMTPLLRAPNAVQAKYDTLVPATTGLFVLERDIRQSDANGVFACTIHPIACGTGASSDKTAAVAVATAVSSGDLGAQFITDTTYGTPVWQGYIVYWRSDTGGTLYRAYVGEPGMTAMIQAPDRSGLQSLAQAAVTTAMGDQGGTSGGGAGGSGSSGGGQVSFSAVALSGVASLSASVDIADDDVTLQIVTAGGAGDRGNTSTFDTDVFTRN
jgi:hypothetical protein